MNDDVRKKLLQMRMAVGFLGERLNYAWWPTSFFESSSALFLEPVFAKTLRLAQYHGVLEAARKLHDEHLNIGSYHLFRLPEETEHALHCIVQAGSPKEYLMKDKQHALDALENLCGQINTKFAEGPIAIGRIEELGSTQVLESMAGGYLCSFQQNKKTYPYLTR